MTGSQLHTSVAFGQPMAAVHRLASPRAVAVLCVCDVIV